MYVGVQGIGTSKMELEFLRRHGVTHMDSNADAGNLDELVRERETAAAAGVDLEMIHIPLAESIPLALDPQRDQDIDEICRWIENAGKSGLRGLNYNFSTVGYQRTETRYGRGGSGYSSWEFSKYDNDKPHKGGNVDRDEIFARISYFLERVIPVAEEYKVQMACHLPDPPAHVLRGEERWNFPVFEGLKRFSELVDSPCHGFNFCCGVASEGLEKPGEQLPEIVEYFSSRQKIFNVHFRNIRGGLNDFVEVWPDEGDVDMLTLARIFHRTGYPYMLMPDHAPSHPDDKHPPGVSVRVSQGWAFQFGYIIAMIQAVSTP
ncbi:MAG: TIM barrel protein [Gemmatimonadetes bacterium]|jgi:mannonate dehydratase|nr:TIM barrel protein [Gemmatimonadota bacterium]MBT4612539.1 TIM barrel protein [Gemmatimonadota bacterium]MBT5056939.1 TIM barrel protein [Gemmatimonadota bacterium]MBT5142192.1 TIM barrel protein [Gemmatimonadota bacterium]MBT5589223.1 TIM barrel protein [Gemmatimonadota bacterium]